MHPEVLDQTMLLLSKRLGFLKEFSFYLAGGTGLALQLGHRKSFDLDFFTSHDFAPEDLSSYLKKNKISITGEIRTYGTLHGIVEGVKMSFMSYKSILLFHMIEFNSLNVADWRDITAEKLRTVADRGQKKDFYDLYFGIKCSGMENIIHFCFKKFGKNVNYFHILKGMTYFEDAEKSPEPLLMDASTQWQDVKSFFLNHIQVFEIAFQKEIDTEQKSG